jgi:hypothetical protein
MEAEMKSKIAHVALLLSFYIVPSFTLAEPAAVTVREAGVEMAGAGTYSTEQRIVTTAKKQRVDPQGKAKGSFWLRLMPIDRSISISRLDLGLMWGVDDKKKQYREESYAESVRNMEKIIADDKEFHPTSKINKVTVVSKKTGRKEKIGAFATEEHEFSIDMEIENLKSGLISHSKTVVIGWYTAHSQLPPEALALILKFERSEAGLLGYAHTDLGERSAARAGMMMGLDPKSLRQEFRKASASFKKPNGYPIRTSIAFYMPRSARDEKQPVEEKREEKRASLRSFSLGGLIAGAVAKKLEKPKDDKPTNQEPKPEVRATSELRSIEFKDVPSTQFEIPAGYLKTTSSSPAASAPNKSASAARSSAPGR